MASDKSKGTSHTAPADAEAGGSEWTELQTDRKVWKADANVPVRGFLLGMVDMPAGANGREWQAFVIKTTAPTKATDRDKVSHEIEAGEEVLVPATHQLRQHLANAASHERVAFEVQILPLKKVPSRGGSMWTYGIAVNRRPIQRNAEMRFLAVSSAKALPQNTEPSGEDNVPF